jgi:hypothetical protein
MYGYDLLTKHEYELICAYDDVYDEATEFLEGMGDKGKLYLYALTKDKASFFESFRKYEMDSVHSSEF